MEQLLVKFNALDGDYTFSCQINDDIVYQIETSIEALDNKEGVLLGADRKLFTSKIKEAGITSWKNLYQPTGLKIDDSVKWEVEYTVDNKTYKSKGEEGYWPYNFDLLIEALLIADDKANYFLTNQK